MLLPFRWLCASIIGFNYLQNGIPVSSLENIDTVMSGGIDGPAAPAGAAPGVSAVQAVAVSSSFAIF